jgi:outer membrane protein
MLAGSMRATLTNMLKALGFWALASVAWADAAAPAAPPVPAESHWRLGVALGYGERTNPLVQSEKIPVLVDLDIAWFGKRFFFDNGDLGFTVLDRPAFSLNAVARVNTDRAFFSKTNTRYINFQYLAAGDTGALVTPPGGPAPQQPQSFKPPRRDYAIEFGFESLFDGEWGSATLHGFHDVSGTHNGFEIGADYDYRYTRGRFSIAPSVGVEYKSANLNDYYWGVHADEASPTIIEYHVDDGFGWHAGLRTNYYVTKHLRAALSVNYERLQTSVAESPLVKDDYVLGFFGGFAWTF